MTLPRLGLSVPCRSSDDPSRGTCLLSYAENEDYMPECNEVPNEDSTDPARISTGSIGLDHILGGGLVVSPVVV